MLMTLALRKWSTLVGNKEVKAFSPESEHIVALTLVVDKLKDNNLKLSKAIVRSCGQVNNYSTQKAANNPKYGASREKKSSRNNKSYQYAWKKVPPILGEKHTGKSVGDKFYNWCPDHMVWCVHTADECNVK